MEEDQIKDVELNQTEQEKLEEQQEQQEQQENKNHLDKHVLFRVAIGIVAVFPLMMLVNGFIFHYITEQKTAYYLSILSSNAMFMLVILIVKKSRGLTWAELGWKPAKFKAGVIDVIKIWGITWIIHIVYMLILFSFGINPPENALDKLLQDPSIIILLLNIFLIAIAAAVIEETLFRGLLFGSMRTYLGTWTAIILSAVIFSALHFEWIGFIPRFVLGVGLGYLYVKHRSIYPSIALHGLNNLLAVVMISAFS